jgi:outer membrane protein
MRSFVVIVALGLVLGAAPAYAQATPPAAGTTQPAPAQPRPFPEGTKFAFINIQRVASESGEGKASTSKVQALNQQKVAQLNELNKKLQADQQKLQSQASVMNDAARGQLERDIERQQKEIQRFTQDAQDEVQNLQQDLQGAFQSKLLPIIQQVVQERGLQILFSQNDAGIVWADPGLDITADVIKRFDAAAPAAATPPAATPPAAAPATPPAKPQK